MGGKILFCETNKAKCPGELEAFAAFMHREIIKLSLSDGISALSKELKHAGPEVETIFLPGEFRTSPELKAAIASNPLSRHAIWVDAPVVAEPSPVFSYVDSKDLTRPGFLNLLGVAFNPNRTLGVKTFLKEASTIYSHSFTSPSGLGSSLDQCLDFAKQSLEMNRALSFWAALNALVADSLSMISGSTEAGARVEFQIGFDAESLAASVRFPCAPIDLEALSKKLLFVPGENFSPWMMAREQANLSELRIYEENQSVEFGMVFLRKGIKQANVRPLIIRQISKLPLEDAESVARYKFLGFNSLGKKKSSAFKKTFSERLNEIKKDEKTDLEVVAPNSGNGDLLEVKIKTLEDVVAQRDQAIAKLTKEIEEINDPLKRGVVSGVIDQQKQALMQKLKMAEDALKLANNREKELMGMVDKAIQQKDKISKELKAAESKLDQASSGNNSLVVNLQKQLDEANKRTAALSKKITDLTDKKVA